MVRTSVNASLTGNMAEGLSTETIHHPCQKQSSYQLSTFSE